MSDGQKIVGTEWEWFTDYAFLWSSWTINVQPGREVEVGVGVSIGGKPRGGKFKASGHFLFKTWGAGAIKVRVADGKGPCVVRMDRGDVGVLPVYGDPSLLKQAWKDAKKVIK